MTVAHLNWGTLKHDFGDPRVADFVDNIGRVNAVAERSPGYVWRLTDEAAEVAALGPDSFLNQPRVVATLSVWADVASFAHFVEKTLHGRFMAQRTAWFERSTGPAHVIWPISDDHRPNMAEAAEKATLLVRNGASEDAFNLAYARKTGALSVPTS